MVSTHSRLKAAGFWLPTPAYQNCRFNTQPPKGGWLSCMAGAWFSVHVSTHSRLKAAGSIHPELSILRTVSTHSRLKAAGFDEILASL